MDPIIKSFLEISDTQFERMELTAKVAWNNGECMLCGSNPRHLHELQKALKKEFIKLNKSFKEETK